MDEVEEVYEYKEWWQRGRDKQQSIIVDLIKNYKTTPEGLVIIQDILDLIDGHNIPKRFRDISNGE